MYFELENTLKVDFFYRFCFIFILTLLPSVGSAQNFIDLKKTLFGVEYTFQDSEMLKEEGRATMTTPYKEQKLKEMLSAFLNLMNYPESILKEKFTHKPGWFINTPTDGQYVINTEPVTIEFNTSPKHLNELEKAAEPIYAAANSVGLAPYVNPAAERSGMGHVHVGGHTLQESPFYQNENLLRNVMVFFHKHPALLFAFAEAYDVGMGSNIETYHKEDRQRAFAEAIQNYDEWYMVNRNSPHQNGFLYLINLLRNSEGKAEWTRGTGFSGFFAHYKFLGLKRLRFFNLKDSPAIESKLTVEFRMFRPPRTPQHSLAIAKFLVVIMDYLAEPGHLETFEWITPTQYSNFLAGSKMKADWQQLKNQLNINDPLLDNMVKETVENIHNKQVLIDKEKGIEIFEAYSEKEHKGKKFEIRLDGKLWREPILLTFKSQKLFFEKVLIGKSNYWIANLEILTSESTLTAFRVKPMDFLTIDKEPQGSVFCEMAI
jgi:hypothetical protein